MASLKRFLIGCLALAVLLTLAAFVGCKSGGEDGGNGGDDDSIPDVTVPADQQGDTPGGDTDEGK